MSTAYWKQDNVDISCSVTGETFLLKILTHNLHIFMPFKDAVKRKQNVINDKDKTHTLTHIDTCSLR